MNAHAGGGAAVVSKAKYGPDGAPHAIPLSHDHRYLQSEQHPAPDYWHLSSFYVPQFKKNSQGINRSLSEMA
jgi:hypothetical protein